LLASTDTESPDESETREESQEAPEADWEGSIADDPPLDFDLFSVCFKKGASNLALFF